MKYKVSLTQRTRIHTEMDADSEENAYWKVMDLLKIPEHNESYVEIIKKGAVEGVEVITSSSIISLITAVERIAYAAIPVLPLELAFLEMTSAELKS